MIPHDVHGCLSDGRYIGSAEADAAREPRIIPKLARNVSPSEHVKYTPKDAVLLIPRKRNPPQRAGGIGFQNPSKCESPVLLDELDTDFNARGVAGVNALDDLIHHWIDPAVAVLCGLSGRQIARSDLGARCILGISGENFDRAPATLSVVIDCCHVKTYALRPPRLSSEEESCRGQG